MNAPGRGPGRRLLAWIGARRWAQALVLVAVCAAVFLPRLGATGLSMSEGHRVIPAWEMLDDARAGEPHWLVPRMFGTAYLRKPPGVMWAIAASSAVLGQNEFAARLPSAIAATLLSVAVWWFATRWFGSPWGLAAGLAQALLPVTWPSARSAEIESLHMLTTGLAALLAVEALLGRWTIRPKVLIHAGLSLSSASMLVTKGVAGFPICIAPILVRMRHGLTGIGSARSGLAVGALVAGGFIAAPLLQRWVTTPPPGAPVVRQGVEEFLWHRSELLSILTLAPVVLVTMLPASLCALFPWGPDAERERLGEGDEVKGPTGARPSVIARVLGWSAVLSLFLLTALGVGNPRYGLPVSALLTPLAAYVARGVWGNALASGRGPGAFVGSRPRIARTLLLGSPFAWPAILLACAAVYIAVLEPDRRESSGREAGISLAVHLPDGAVVWADELIEARPEVLLYAVREADRQGRRVRVRWLKPGFMPQERPEGLLLLLREDELIDEVAWYTNDGRFGVLTPIARGEVHKYEFVLMRPEYEP